MGAAPGLRRHLAAVSARNGAGTATRPSRALLEGPDRAAARAYLKGIGFDDDALARPIVGIANTWTETMPCNFHLRRLAAVSYTHLTLPTTPYV